MKEELETIIENEFDCLIDDLGFLIGEEWKAEAIKEAVTKAFVLGGVMQWVVCKEELPKEDGDYLINWDGTVIEAGYYVEQNLWHDYTVSEYKGVTHWMHLPKPPCA